MRLTFEWGSHTLTTKDDNMKIVHSNHESQHSAKPPVVCSACGAINSICWDKKEVGIDDKAGTWLTLELDFCQECGKVHNYSLY